MCGIAGILNFNGQPASHSQLKSMTDAIAHRGPDGEGHFVKNNIGLGHRRLAIIDLTPAAHQPMQTKNQRYVISYNGEVYNFKELRIELESLGYQFHSNTDSEVVLNAYCEWQEDCLNKFNGMFAFAVWDTVENTLFLARDRYGIKPLYYYHDSNKIIFASEIKSIIASKAYKSELDPEGLVEYLTFQNFFSNKTLFNNITTLMPGHCAKVSANGKFTISSYWDFDFSKPVNITEQEAIEETDRLFRQAVNRQLISDVPVNAYLSGGIDSGSITMIAKQFLPHMQNFTVGFDLSSASGLELSFDERKNAEHISYLAQTEHYEMVLKAGDMERCMDNYVYHLEEPRVGQSYPNFYAAKLAAKFGKVVLSGCGGDELFGGYPWRYFYSQQNVSFDNFIDAYYLKWQRLLHANELQQLLTPIWNEVSHVDTKTIFRSVFGPYEQAHLTPAECLQASLYLEAKTFLHGLLTVEDKLSMAHGLETRVPFLDNDLVDFAMRLPINHKIASTPEVADENDLKSKIKAHYNGKRILRKTFSRYLDEKTVQNKKQGFSSPDATWFKGESIDYVEKQLEQLPAVMSHQFACQIFEAHKNNVSNNRLVIWSLLYLTKLLNNEWFT